MGVQLSSGQMRGQAIELIFFEKIAELVGWMVGIKDIQVRTAGRLCAEKEVLMHKLKKP